MRSLSVVRFCALALLTVGSCAGSENGNVDVVNGVAPVSTAFSSIREDLVSMENMSGPQRADYIREHWPHLSQGVVYFLRQRGMIGRNTTAVSRVEFRYGSLEGVRAESARGEVRGHFSNQLVALVFMSNVVEPIVVLVQCLNGMFALPDDVDRLDSVSGDFYNTINDRFTIERGEGLVHHVDFPVAIDLARRFDLPLYRGKIMDERTRITPRVALAMESRTDRVQVTVKVFEGDTFDLAAGTFTPSPQRR